MIRARKRLPHVSKQRGFTLIEALVAMLILSIGLLGVAAVQVKSIQYSHASYQRSVAVVQANDLVERLWAGICALPGSLTDIESDWIAAHQNSLPNWDGEVELDGSDAPPLYTIRITWDDERAADGVQQQFVADGVQQQFVYDAILPTLACN